MKSKREMRKSMRVSASTANEQEESFVNDEEGDLNSPTQAFADLEGQKRVYPEEKEKEMGEKE